MKRLISTLVLVVLLAAMASPVYAQGSDRSGLVAFGRNIVVQAGETVTGDVVAFGGNVTVEAKAQVTGDVVAFGGNVRSAGEVSGSVIALGGNVDLEADSLVRKDVVTLGGTVNQAAGARVQGNVSRGLQFELGDGTAITRPLPLQPISPTYRRPWAGDLALSIIVGFVAGMIKLAVLVALAVVLVAIFPRQIAGVKATMITQPGASAGVGCLTYVAAVALTLPLLLTCIGNFLMWPALFITSAFGLGALGLIVGERLTASAAGQAHSVAFHAAVGTGLLVVGLLVLDAIPLVGCFSWIFWLLVASLTTGAVILSKFGTQAPAIGASTAATPAAGIAPEAPTAAGTTAMTVQAPISAPATPAQTEPALPNPEPTPPSEGEPLEPGR